MQEFYLEILDFQGCLFFYKIKRLEVSFLHKFIFGPGSGFSFILADFYVSINLKVYKMTLGLGAITLFFHFQHTILIFLLHQIDPKLFHTG